MFLFPSSLNFLHATHLTILNLPSILHAWVCLQRTIPISHLHDYLKELRSLSTSFDVQSTAEDQRFGILCKKDSKHDSGVLACLLDTRCDYLANMEGITKFAPSLTMKNCIGLPNFTLRLSHLFKV